MTTSALATPLHARRAAASLESFDPRPLGVHQVGVGDSLASIAALWYGPERAGLFTLIVATNYLTGTAITVGQLLAIPRIGWRAL